jgi:hypothetical protein
MLDLSFRMASVDADMAANGEAIADTGPQSH